MMRDYLDQWKDKKKWENSMLLIARDIHSCETFIQLTEVNNDTLL